MKINTEALKMENEAGRASSKGNQNKWLLDGVWYKADGLGYEALAEVLISRLLEKTNAEHFVRYEYEPLVVNGSLARGCRSEDFMNAEDDKLVSVERMFQTFTGKSAAKAILKHTEIADRIQYVSEIVAQFTGLDDFDAYLKKILTLDALFLNEDRHFHNIAVIRRKDGTYRECPVFDNGASLFSDLTRDYPLGMELEQCYEKIRAKPFSSDFDEQADACDILCGSFRFKAAFTMKDVDAALNEFRGIYEEEIRDRVRCVMRMQMRKYAFLF